jgi:hypothetical protein
VRTSKEDMEATRVACWGAIKPCGEAFVETRIPGHEKNLDKIINCGVLGKQGAQLAIQGKHRFSISMIKARGTGQLRDDSGLHHPRQRIARDRDVSERRHLTGPIRCAWR